MNNTPTPGTMITPTLKALTSKEIRCAWNNPQKVTFAGVVYLVSLAEYDDPFGSGIAATVVEVTGFERFRHVGMTPDRSDAELSYVYDDIAEMINADARQRLTT